MFLCLSILPAAQIFDLAIYIYNGDGDGGTTNNDHNSLAISFNNIDRSILDIFGIYSCLRILKREHSFHYTLLSVTVFSFVFTFIYLSLSFSPSLCICLLLSHKTRNVQKQIFKSICCCFYNFELWSKNVGSHTVNAVAINKQTTK